MHDLDSLTIYQKAALIRDATGYSPRLQPYDEIVKVLISPTRCGITVRRWNVTERATESRLTRPRLVTHAWTLDPVTDEWQPVLMEVEGKLTAEFSLSDETVTQHKIVSHRGGKLVDEFRDQLYWHALSSRPGSGRLGQRDYDGVQREIAKVWNKTLGKSDYEYHMIGEE